MGAMQRSSANRTVPEKLLRHHQTPVVAGLAAIVLLAWAYLFHLARNMGSMAAMTGMEQAALAGAPMPIAWGPVDFALMFLMWAVMMVAMMIPAAAPVLLAFAGVNRRRREAAADCAANPDSGPRAALSVVPTGMFLAGYLLVWSLFSLAATFAQWGLNQAALLSPMMSSASPLLGGCLLLAAGAFQWSPLKSACLRHCRTPIGFLVNDWREGCRGAARMGLQHGVYCLGCCWALMGLLFVLGVMNLLWIAALSLFVLAEKAAPAGRWIGRIGGAALLTWGLWLLWSSGLT